MRRKNAEFHPDASQQRVIDAEGGYHLVLAPPGCGKTQILTERIRRAHERDGVPYDQMLCLTFTNRAARGMIERIRQNIDDDEVAQVYVGNVHRFCSKFLFENNILPAETSIIDEEDSVSIVARYLDEDEMQVMENAVRRREYFEIVHFSHFMRQIRSAQPRELRLHPESCTAEDIVSMKKICEVQRMNFDAEAMLDIYDHADFYLTNLHSAEDYDLGSQAVIERLLRKMTVSAQYEQYKRENHLVDFEDLLIMAYDNLRSKGVEKLRSKEVEELVNQAVEDSQKYKKYRWIQVDEVQDLNPLQLAIIDLITDTSSP
ncbi:MAG: UvrD-helicase domain-containing protein, partial [Prevotella sp.]|nr:UvrD-helicase domain-containing protein [Prevotella sp.]